MFNPFIEYADKKIFLPANIRSGLEQCGNFTLGDPPEKLQSARNKLEPLGQSGLHLLQIGLWPRLTLIDLPDDNSSQTEP